MLDRCCSSACHWVCNESCIWRILLADQRISSTTHAKRDSNPAVISSCRELMGVPADEDTAINGHWRPGPGKPLFDALENALGSLPLVAEDLGEITPDVVALRKELGLPGMAILHFAFSPDPRSIFIPYALERDLVVYTGTHDNNTTVGWFIEDATEEEKDLVRRYTASSGREINWELIRLAMGSVCENAIVPHQDLVGLGADCRMNTPSVGEGNWSFRITPPMLVEGIQARFYEVIEAYGRVNHV